MKKLVFIVMLLVCYSAYAQETDTVLYSSNECSEPIGDSDLQNVSMQLKNDTLTISGKIIANCCGVHFLIYEVFEDSVYFSRLDTGNLCDCYCLQDINIKIGGCTSSFYNIKLYEYSGNDGLDTVIYANQTGIINKIEEKKIKICPNPFNETTTIDFLNPNFDCYTFKMFDCSGRLIKTLNGLNTNSFQLNGDNLHSGIYYFHLFNSDVTYYSGKLLIQ